MHRTQISLEEPLYEALRRSAFERRISMAQMVREALAGYLGVDLGPVADPDRDSPPGAPATEAGARG